MTTSKVPWACVRFLHTYHQSGLKPGVHLGAPGTAVVWVIDLDGSYRLDAAGTNGAQPFSSSVSGLSTRPAAIHHGAVQSGIYIELTPTATRAMFGVPAAELAGRSVELAALWGTPAERLLDQLHTASPSERESLLRAQIHRRLSDQGNTSEVDHLWRLATERGLTPSQLAQQSGWSTRHLRRLLLHESGVTPRTARRLARFERSLADVRRRHLPLAAAAARHGYADQAHLTRDWRELLGVTPTEFLQREG